ncbi:MAG: hypothetical protein JKY80_02130 [Mariprofundaceae bacterium]|nr:hypothetical protein [Methylophaga sp.]MBL4759638.1 hypothetical protein [Mariprofundaceae bacterium]
MARRKKVETATNVEVEETATNVEVSIDAITNTSKNKRCINHIMLEVNESYTLTERDMEDERLMMKIDRAIDLGVLSRG